MNEAALRARSLTLADGQVVVPIEDVLDLAATPSGGPLQTAERLAIYQNGWDDALAAPPSGGPLDVPKWLETLTTYHVFPNDKLNARETTVFQMTVGYIKRQYARLTEDAG